jgi:predicted permease
MWQIVRRRKIDAEVDEELHFHLEEEIRTQIEHGASPAEARRLARLALGGLAQAHESVRDVRSIWIDDVVRDVRHALRMLRRSPAFSIIAILALALGIGASTAVFSVVHAVVLNPLPFPHPDQLVALRTLSKETGGHAQVSLPDFEDWRDGNTSFEAIALYSAGESAIVINGSPQFATVARVSDQFFAVFGVAPLLGRSFSRVEAARGSVGAAVVSHAFWLTRLGGDTSALGRSIIIAGRSVTIVGVMPQPFVFPEPAEIWIPFDTVFRVPSPNRGGRNYLAVGRLRPGVRLEAARTEMRAVGDRLERQYAGTNSGTSVAVTPLVEEMVGDTSRMLFLLLGAVFVLLLIACGNVANLLVARAAGRSREMGVRAALGAGRGRIVRQLVAESLVLGVAGATVGLLLGRIGTATLVALSPSAVPRLDEATIDSAVTLFAVGITFAACLSFGLMPAIAVSGLDVHAAVSRASRNPGGIGASLRRVLVVAEIALAVVLLVGAGLLIRSLARLSSVDLGFTVSRVLVMATRNQVSPTGDRAAVTRIVERYRALLDDFAMVPGVERVAAVRVPPGAVTSDGAYAVDAAIPAGLSTLSPQAVYSIVSPQAFAVLGIPILSGRDFSAADGPNAPATAIVNETLAKAAFPGADPVGHSIIAGMDSLAPMTIVGVVGDVRQRGPGEAARSEIYLPFEQHQLPSTALRILVRISVQPESLAGTLRQRALAIAPDMPVNFTTMSARMAETVAVPRFRTVLLVIFAGFATLLTMAGVYGVLSFLVSQRTQEIGLRMALGATAAQVVGMVVGQAWRMAAIGLLFGLIGAAAAAQLMESMLFEVQPLDPSTYGAVAGAIMLVVIGACAVPARRAARMDPAVVLRAE